MMDGDDGDGGDGDGGDDQRGLHGGAVHTHVWQ